MKTYSRIFLLAASVLFWTSSSQAIPVSYGTATHQTTKWQELASSTSESGVSWSVDNGTTWGQDDLLLVGQSIQFKFEMHKDNVGTHYADFMKAWVDWDQDGTFDAKDQVAFGENQLTSHETGNLGTNSSPNVADFTFFSQVFELTDEHVGDFWLRARVTCSHSFVARDGGHWNDQWGEDYVGHYEEQFLPTGHYYQGETEDLKFTVSSVPEPSSIFLLGLGLMGLAVSRKRSK